MRKNTKFICVYLRCTWADKLMQLYAPKILLLLNQQEKKQRPRSISIPGGFVPPNYINNLVGFIYTNRIIVGLLCYLRFLGSEMKRCALDRKHALLENVWLLCCFVSLSVIDFLVACYER